MRHIIPRLAIAILACTIGFTTSRLVHNYSGIQANLINHLSSPELPELSKEALELNPGKQDGDDADFDLAAEISIERIYDGCVNCADRKIVLRRDGSKSLKMLE